MARIIFSSATDMSDNSIWGIGGVLSFDPSDPSTLILTNGTRTATYNGWFSVAGGAEISGEINEFTLTDTSLPAAGQQILHITELSLDFVGLLRMLNEQPVALFSVLSRDDVLHGSRLGDTLQGRGGEDLIYGHGGNDLIYANNPTAVWANGLGDYYNDTLSGGAGNDTLVGSSFADDWANDRYGGDKLSGGAGNDLMLGGQGNDSLSGGSGSDTFNGGGGYDLAYFVTSGALRIDLNRVGAQNTGEGMDTFISIENVFGGSGNDSIVGNAADNEISGNLGNDTLFGGAGYDYLSGGQGDDQLFGGDGYDALLFLAGNDTIAGGAGVDTLIIESVSALGVTIDLTRGGRQAIGPGSITLNSVENVVGGFGNDTLTGTRGDNQLNGHGGNDSLSGLGGDDFLDGGFGEDRLIGGAGSDYLSGGTWYGPEPGYDADGDGFPDPAPEYGDGARDVFVFASGDGDDTIGFFEIGVDKIEITSGASGFGDLTFEDSQWETATLIRFGDVSIYVYGAFSSDLGVSDFIFSLV